MQPARQPTSVTAHACEPDESRVDLFVRQCRAVAARLTDIEGDGRFDALMEAIHQAPVECGTRDGRAVIAALVAELASRVLHETARDRTDTTAFMRLPDLAWTRAGGNAHVAVALEVLRRRSSEPALSLATLAAAVGVSRCHLSRLLRHWTGLGFFGLLATLRVQEAKRLLSETALSIKEVAARCGYEHVSQLDRQFRRECGLTPRIYRLLWQAAPAACRIAPAPGRS